MASTHTLTGLGKGRIEALGDGVFAIAMTLLVLDLQPPALTTGIAWTTLLSALLALWPKGLAYVISFLALGGSWVGHHAQLHHVCRVDRVFLWLNLVYLVLISAVPFSTAVLVQYREEPVAIVLHSTNLALVGLLLYGQMRYAATRGRLFNPDLDPRLLQLGGQRILLGPPLHGVAILWAFLVPWIGFALCVLTPLLYVVPGRVDRFWTHRV